MNIRGTDSTALTAVTDLFVAPTPPRDGGAGGFQQALQPPRPYEATPAAAPRQDSNPPPQQAKRSESPIEDSPRCEHEACDAPAAGSETSEDDVTPKEAASLVEEAIPVATVEPSVTEETADEQNVAAESLAAAVGVVAEQDLPEQQLPAVTIEAVATEPLNAEPASNDETPSPVAADSLARDTQLTIATFDQPIENVAIVATAGVAEATPVEPIPQLLEDTNTAEGTEPTAGIGVLPIAITPQVTTTANTTSATRAKPKTASSTQQQGHAEKGSSQTTSAETSQETASIDSSATIRADEAKLTNDESNPGSKRKDQPFSDGDHAPPNAILQPAELPAAIELKSEIPAATTDAPVVSELHSTQNPMPDAAKLASTQSLSSAAITSRLPAQALVRGAPQEKTPVPLHVDAARFLQRVTKAFESARERDGEIRLRLSPPELGALRVEVNMSEHGLAARVEVETNDARTILLENLPALRERLAEQGLRLEKFDVELSQREPEQQGGNFPEQPRDRQSQPEGRNLRSPIMRPSTAAATPTEITPSTGWQDRQLNVIV